ncbi:GDP-mannose 4,6-dehydratase [Candidatus Vecturithrix granuli]|uniref:GDP-mannose 4,6-dehydratase n=1 Tax=Vecturithrix granuli TaxID=1499967 RepID=A0A081BYA1_VECG1|nr:GDP-mannose 4,6-dehydratase [Candidatus Vecturithrix granuli]
MMKKRALLTGITGQDGSYLAEFLLKKGYEVAGIIRRLSIPNTRNIEHILGDVTLYDGDLSDQGSLDRIVRDFQPDEVYNLAAQSFVKVSWQEPILTGDITGLGAVRLLEAVRNHKPEARVYQASSSEMFGNNPKEFLDESCHFLATSPYAIAKLYAHRMTINYRESYGMYACAGILFNHESPRRGIEFVTRKITYAVACIAQGVKQSKMGGEIKEPLIKEGKFKLGNMDSSRDWGYAKDYVEMMWLMLQQETPDEYVIATGRNTTIREFLDIAFNVVGIDDWQCYVELDPRFQRPSDLRYLRGNSSKAQRELGWQPQTTLEELVQVMVEADIELVKHYELR